ncbi:MAG: diguanylate cyclase [Chloroflexi bacterium]|nr:diguanylate cyclase [Chloroflexota bacterium]
MNDPVFVVDADGRMLETNAAFERVFGPAQGTKSIFDRWPELESIWRSALGSITHGRTLQIDVPASGTSGNPIIFDVHLFSFLRPVPGQANAPDGLARGPIGAAEGPIGAAEGPIGAAEGPIGAAEGTIAGVAGVCRDATRDRERTRQLELQATTDDLTGVFSRNQLVVLLDLEIRSAVRRKSTGCFLYLDIDGFKQLNDRFGHAEGDRVLREVAALLEHNLRAADVVARLGGDEFGVILVDAGLEHGLEKAQRLVELLNDVIAGGDVTGRDERITVSMGMAAFPDHGSGASEIIRRADAAMYRAKRKALNRVEVWVDGPAE